METQWSDDHWFDMAIELNVSENKENEGKNWNKNGEQ